MRIKKTVPITIASLIFVGVALTVATSALLTQQNTQKISTNGSLSGSTLNSVNIDVYTNAAATVNCSSIDWGNLSEGNTVNRIVYIKNTGNAVETLNMTIANWNPISANLVLSINWDKEVVSISPGEVVPATFTLKVAAYTGAISSFNFDILISGRK